jgi:hypothetical protein
MITFNGINFAKNDNEFTSSLFVKGATCRGYYKATKRGIQLLDMQENLFAFIVNNKHSEKFVVSCLRMANGKIRYMHSTTIPCNIWLGLDKLGYKGTREECALVLNQEETR